MRASTPRRRGDAGQVGGSGSSGGRRLRGDAGQVGGIEVLPFGVLLFVVGSLLVASVWSVVDATLATDLAARHAARTFVEADDPATALDAARAAALDVIGADGRDPQRATVSARGTPVLARCARVHFEVTYQTPALSVPLLGGVGPGSVTVRSHHSELVDPYRSGVDGDAEGCPG